jgi:hypothetical protein
MLAWRMHQQCPHSRHIILLDGRTQCKLRDMIQLQPEFAVLFDNRKSCDQDLDSRYTQLYGVPYVLNLARQKMEPVLRAYGQPSKTIQRSRSNKSSRTLQIAV